MRINKRERKFLMPAISYGWQLYEPRGRRQKTWHWDDDTLLPVQIGKVCEDLITKGLLERCFNVIRKTKLGESFECKERFCRHGRREECDDDSNLLSTGVCQKCEGIGVISDNQR